MNKEEIKQFENEQLNALLEELKNIDKFTGFKDGAFKYELGKYQANLLLNYIDDLKQALIDIRELANNWGKEDCEGGDCYDLALKVVQIIDKVDLGDEENDVSSKR